MDQIATLAGGCFWCLEAVFDQLKGVKAVESGYMGGKTPNPNYEQVCSGASGHAEVVRVTFDADVLSYRDLLGVFFAIHDPTTLNRQGNDVGTQYRSAIFYHSEEQKRDAEEVIRGARRAEAVLGADRHRGGARLPVPHGRGLPPGVLPAGGGLATPTAAS